MTHSNGAFNNYVDRIFPFLTPPAWTVFNLWAWTKTDIFWPPPPHLVYLVIERPLIGSFAVGLFSSIRSKEHESNAGEKMKAVDQRFCAIFEVVILLKISIISLKVSKSRKQILKFSFEPKNQRKYFCISALAYKKRSNQKSSVRESK